MIVEVITGALGVTVGGLLAGARERRREQAFGVDTRRIARYALFRDFLGEPQRAVLADRIRAIQPQMVPSDVTGDDKSYRRSTVLYHGQHLAPAVLDWMRASSPGLAEAFGVAPFAPGDVECQLTISRGGDYFKRHDDSGCDSTATRRLSWVYYAHPNPRRFDGGELVIYNARPVAGAKGGAYAVQPEGDLLIVFPSSCSHEVRPVRAYGPDVDDARVTLNGWVRTR